MQKQLTLFDDVDDDFSPLLELLVPFSISQRLPSVGLPRAARAPCSKSRRRLKSGNEKDERLRRMLLEPPSAGSFLKALKQIVFLASCLLLLCWCCENKKLHSTDDCLYVWIVMVTDTIHLSLGSCLFLTPFESQSKNPPLGLFKSSARIT